MKRTPVSGALSAAILLAGALLRLDACAEELNSGPRPAEPFKLSVEKRHVNEDAEGQAQSQNLRIPRGQLNMNSYVVPPVAPSRFREATGAQADPVGFPLRAEDWMLPGSAAQPQSLRGGATVRALADYNVELIVDQSMSMRRRDCPGRTSRWDWCGMQLQDLSRQLSPYTPRGFTLTTFASDFQSYDSAGPEHVQYLFSNHGFSLGTRLSRPLNARLNNYFAHRTSLSKPLLIVVITDGVPVPAVEPSRVAQGLIAATRRMLHPNEVTIVFFQIGGGDRFGRYFLNEMDNSLVAHGARYDIVKTVPFEQLQSQGLTGSLVASVRDFAYQAAR